MWSNDVACVRGGASGIVSVRRDGVHCKEVK